MAPLLLGADEPPAALVEHAGAASPFVLACDHAGREIPRALGSLGLSAAESASHIA